MVSCRGATLCALPATVLCLALSGSTWSGSQPSRSVSLLCGTAKFRFSAHVLNLPCTTGHGGTVVHLSPGFAIIVPLSISDSYSSALKRAQSVDKLACFVCACPILDRTSGAATLKLLTSFDIIKRNRFAASVRGR